MCKSEKLFQAGVTISLRYDHSIAWAFLDRSRRLLMVIASDSGGPSAEALRLQSALKMANRALTFLEHLEETRPLNALRGIACERDSLASALRGVRRALKGEWSE